MNLEWTARLCPLCGANQEGRVVLESNIDPAKLTDFAFASRKFPEYMHPRMVECARCGMLYGNPVVSLETISSGYREASFDSSKESHFASVTYRSLLAKHLATLPGKDAALDIGAGDGTFLEQLLSIGFRKVSGVEPSAAPIAAAKPDIRPLIHHRFFKAQDFAPGQFDLVTCFQVMEHLWDPVEMTRDAFALLKPGGMFFVVVHNHRAWLARLLGARSPIFDIEHLQLFSAPTVSKLLRDAGFSHIQVSPVWNRYPLHYWMKLAPLPRVIKEHPTVLGNLLLTIPAGNLAAIGYKPQAIGGLPATPR